MHRPRLDSMLLSSTDPDRLHAWYTTALEPDSDTKVDHYRVLSFGDVHLFIDTRSDIGERNPEPGRLILNFDVSDARAVAARIDALGTTWVAGLEDRDGSLFATAADPDGNYVQLIQVSRAHRAEMMTSGRPGAASAVSGAPAFTSFAVADTGAARSFYADTLGLDVRAIAPMGLLELHLPGGRMVMVYPKPDHRPADFTVLSFAVPDIEAAVDDLVARGVAMVRYDGFDQDARGIARGSDGPPIAWFTDPAGNILAVLEQP